MPEDPFFFSTKDQAVKQYFTSARLSGHEKKIFQNLNFIEILLEGSITIIIVTNIIFRYF